MNSEQRALVAQVGEALERLEREIPGGVEVWAGILENGTSRFTACAEQWRGIIVIRDNPMMAASDLIAAVQTEKDTNNKRIAQLKAELAKLEKQAI